MGKWTKLLKEIFFFFSGSYLVFELIWPRIEQNDRRFSRFIEETIVCIFLFRCHPFSLSRKILPSIPLFNYPFLQVFPCFLFIYFIDFFFGGGSVRAYTLLPQFLDPQNLNFRRISYKSPFHSVLFTFYCFVLFSSFFSRFFSHVFNNLPLSLIFFSFFNLFDNKP